MSTISDLYDNLKTILGTVYPAKYELIDPITIEQNPDQLLDNGFALAVGPATNTRREVCNKLSIAREFTVTLTGLVKGMRSDISAQDTAEKNLLEDHLLLVNELYKNQVLDSIYKKLDYLSDTGIVEIVANEKKYLMIQTTIQIEYFETIF